jgi:hypothetical protein
VESRSVLGRHIFGVEHVFDPDWYPVQRTKILPVLAPKISAPRLLQGVIRIQKRPSPDGLIRIGDPRQRLAHQFLG